MQYARIDELVKNEHISLEDGMIVLLKGYTERDKELFENFIDTVNTYGYGIRSKVEQEK